MASSRLVQRMRADGDMPFYKLAPDALSAPLEDGLIVARPGGDRMFVLNATARVVWDGLGQRKGPATLAARLAARHGVPVKRTRADVEVMLRQWEDMGLLGNGPPPPKKDEDVPVNGTHVPVPRRPRVRRWINRDYAFAGGAFRIRCSDRDTSNCIDRVVDHLACKVPVALSTVLSVYRTDNGYLLLQDKDHLADCTTIDEVLTHVTGTLYDVGYENADWQWMLHASAVGDATGCVVMPAASGSGKSTLAAALTTRGLALYSDEVAPLVGDDLNITPVPVSFSIKEGSWDVLGDWLPEVGAAPVYARWGKMARYVPPRRHATAPAPARSIVFPRYEAGASFDLQPIAPLAVMERINAAVAYLKAPLDEARVKAVVDWVGRTRAYSMTYGRLEDAVPAVVDLLG